VSTPRLKILVGADLHNSRSGLDWFCKLAAAHKPELITFLGDIINEQPLTFFKEVLGVLRDLAPAVFVIPGNWDPREALVEMDIAAFDGLKHLHKASAELAGYRFAGLGGSTPTPLGTTPLEGPEQGFASPLAPLLPADVWLLHNPVAGYRDLAGGTRNVGSPSLYELWRAQDPRPVLVLSGHIHEAAGFERAAPTTFVNPGSLKQRSAAMVTLTGTDTQVEMLGS